MSHDVRLSYKKCEKTSERRHAADFIQMSKSWARQLSMLCAVVLLHACGGGGGGSAGNNSTPAATPLSVLPSSYENKMAALPVALTQLPKLSAVAALASGLTLGMDSVPASLAVADFQRNGSYSAFVIASDGTSQARAYMVGYGATGNWTDLSDSLFRNSTDRVACVRPEQAAVADLNSDGRPDVYVACSGNAGGSVPQVLYLSQTDGKYQKTTTTVQLNATSVALADIDGDTNACKDVVTTHNGALQVMMATACNGVYTLSLPADNTGRVPQSAVARPPSNVRNVFLVPRANRRYDLLVGGDGSLGFSFKWFLNNGNYGSSGYFDTTDVTKVRDYLLTVDTGNNRYDYLESGSYGYIYIRNGATQAFGGFNRIPLPGVSSTISYSVLTPPASHSLTDWPVAMRLVDNSLRVYDAGCDLLVALNNSSRCGRQYLLSDFPP